MLSHSFSRLCARTVGAAQCEVNIHRHTQHMCKMYIKSCFMLKIIDRKYVYIDIFFQKRLVTHWDVFENIFLLFINVTCWISGTLVLLTKIFSCASQIFGHMCNQNCSLTVSDKLNKTSKVHYVDQQISSIRTASYYTPITFGV